VRTKLQPDMVFFLDERSPERERKGISVCLREDKESALDASKRAELLSRLTASFGPMGSFDTITPYRVSAATRTAELERVWNHLRGVRVAVTDRLHGMIFALITGTPCVALRSFDHKVIEGYGWMKGHQNYVFMVEDPTPKSVEQTVHQALAVERPQLADLRKAFFSDLRETLLST
jgi:pyruvyl transferase EpsI